MEINNVHVFRPRHRLRASSGTIIFILDIIAIVMVLMGGKSVGMKLLWILIILLLPLIGMILYFLLGRGGD